MSCNRYTSKFYKQSSLWAKLLQKFILLCSPIMPITQFSKSEVSLVPVYCYKKNKKIKKYLVILRSLKKKKKKKPCFTGGRVGRSGLPFLNIFFFLVAKMTPLKTQKSPKKSDVFLRKILELSIPSYFQKFSGKFSLTLAKKGCIYMILTN